MNYRIVVDAGHGGEDPGAISGNFKEKDFTLKAANYMYNRFRELGVPVIITRDTDKTLSRNERLNIMRSLGTDSNVIILSNHINAGNGEGAEVVYPLRTSDKLPKMILDEIGKEGQIMRKVYQRRLPENPSKDYYYIMRETPNTTALLLEYGFIDNKNDQVKLQNSLLNYVEGVIRAVMNYIGLPYVAPGGMLDNTYTVKRGDTLYSIARQYNTTVDRLKTLNNLSSNTLSIGQVLVLDNDISTNPNPDNKEVYLVEPGDTLYKIANQFNTNVGDIIELNNLNSTILTVGQQLLIPAEIIIEEPNISIPSDTYQVQPGDTLYKIANDFNTTVAELKQINNLTSNTLSIGQILNIGNINPSTQTYTVQRGDSLWLIANKLNTTVDELKRINNLSTNLLQIGQVLLIPE